MLIGVFADTHDHLDNIRWIVAEFNRRRCQLALFAGDFVSTFALPPLRGLRCPLVATFGDNEGNRLGIVGGMEVLGTIADPPFCVRTADGVKILLTHQRELIRGQLEGSDVVIYAHTHRPSIRWDEAGRLLLNPGEASGWTYRHPTVALLQTDPLGAELLALPAPPDPSAGLPS